MCLDIYWLLEKTKAKKPSRAGENHALASDKAFLFHFMFLTKMTKKEKEEKKGERGGGGGEEDVLHER